jgi:hypothetical protein
MHDLMAHIDRRPVEGQRALHDVDGAHHPGAETAGGGQQDGKRWLGHAKEMRGAAALVNRGIVAGL